MQTIPQILAKELGKPQQAVENVIALLDQGNTIPFIARYRKEQHGSMDDTALRKLEDRLRYLRNLEMRRQEVKSAIDGQGKLTEELSASIDNAATLAEVEDLYRPYKQKRRTRATIAREKGLEPLALLLLAQAKNGPAPEDAAQAYLDPEKGVETVADALQAAGLPMFAAMPFFSGYTTGNLLNVLYICVFVTAGGYACYFMGMEATSAMQGSLVFFFKPVLAPILAMLILGEEIPWNMWAGIGLMLVASVVSMIPTWETLLSVRPFIIDRILHRQH